VKEFYSFIHHLNLWNYVEEVFEWKESGSVLYAKRKFQGVMLFPFIRKFWIVKLVN